MKYLPWKHALLAGSFALFALSGSSATAGGRPYDPALMPVLAPYVFQTNLFADGGQLLPAAYPAEGIVPLIATAEPLAAPVPAETAQPAEQTQQAPAAVAIAPVPVKPKATATSDTAKKAQPKPAKPKAPAESKTPAQPAANTIVTASGKEIKATKTIKAVASAYTGSAEENGGYAGLDYFGNALKVGTIAVDPKVIPLGTKVYVTGYRFDGLPAGGMMAVASDTGGAIKGNRIDIFVPSTGEQAKTFGFQNVTVHVVD